MQAPIWQRSAVETAAAIRDGLITSEEVVQVHIERMHTVNPALNAVVIDLSNQAISASPPPTLRRRTVLRWANSTACR